MTGTNSRDFLRGTSGNDTIRDLDGNDRAIGGDGDDYFINGDGNDLLSGGNGNDTLVDGAGLDTLLGGNGNDTFIIFDSNGLDVSLPFDPSGFGPTINGGSGTDTIDTSLATTGIAFAGTTFGGFAVEIFWGSNFGDNINASTASADLLLNGGGGDDTLIGGSGDDQITGGTGGDALTGGGGNDRFELAALTDSLLGNFDQITDFSSSDVIDAPGGVRSVTAAGAAASLTEASIASTLGAFVPNGAATFTVGSSTYLALNDGATGFNQATDAIIEITGFSGTLSIV
ncbi:MAG: calcium-binding protein [Leptolyngbya sp. SIOISBB]|nr:calcium-binding protein [Leptolyngbya sp. SIOISBB]